ncbi:MAG: RHS repeat-associated core domain-containing protein [Candidatus Omnitrophota bacterium]
MNKIIRTILSLLIVLTNLDVRILHAQVALTYSPVLPVTLVTPSIINLPVVTSSIFEKEKTIELSALSFSFSKTDFVALSGPSKNLDGLSSSTTRRPAASGIIRADLFKFHSTNLRQRFPSGTRLKHARSDKHYVEALPVVRKLRLRTDYQGRRVQKAVSTWAGVAWVQDAVRQYVYDGWNVIRDTNTVGTIVTDKYYVWGLDLSQSMQGAGGIGGLLVTVDGSTPFLFHHHMYDGNGNVTQLVDVSDGSIDAQYEYDPYGNTILSSGILANSNPYRFSTKYLDTESGLYYYGYRYYDPEIGRWLNRDPIGEQGGLNVYGFINNNPILYVDALGLYLEFAINGTRAHTLFRNWGRNKFPAYDWEILLFNMIKPDVIDQIGERIWDLKPKSHSIPTWRDKKQMSDYLCLTGYELGEPQDITNGRTYIGIIADVLTGNPLDVYIYPGATGFILYDLVPRDDSKIPIIIPAKKEKKKEKSRDNNNFTPTTKTDTNTILVNPGLLNPILIPSVYGN